jgi:hypothetical protein
MSTRSTINDTTSSSGIIRKINKKESKRKHPSHFSCKLYCLMQSYNNTNIMIMSIPHRYDLHKDSRINLAIQKLNRKLKNMTQLFKHVTIIETDSNRKIYTKLGLHLNNKGKEKLARSIANIINKLMLKDDKDKSVITLNWKDEINRYTSAQVSPDQLKKF